MQLARKFRTSGSVTPAFIPKHGYYTHGLPASTPLRYKLRTKKLEALLRLRLAGKGLWRGLTGKVGVLAAGRLYATVIRSDGTVEHLGLLSTKLVTDAGVAFLVDDWDGGANDFSLFNFHGCGTGNTAEAAGDTALVTESTTVLDPNSTRATGTKSQPAANQLRSVGILTFDGAATVVEHGLFSQEATGGGTLWDRSVFGAITVGSGDSIQFTYTCTLASGG